jgi:hypothetical protein
MGPKLLTANACQKGGHTDYPSFSILQFSPARGESQHVRLQSRRSHPAAEFFQVMHSALLSHMPVLLSVVNPSNAPPSHKTRQETL